MQPDQRLAAGKPETFASLLRRHRVRSGLCQEALAARAGLSRRGIADLERGARRRPYPDTAGRLAAALGLGPADRVQFMAACRPAPNPGVARHTLSTEPTPLIGRVTELAEIFDLLTRTRLLTLTGVGGVGKTRLALELAHRVESSYAAGAVLVDLAPVIDDTGVAETALAALGLSQLRGESAAESVRRQLEGEHLLILLDNCEHVIGASARLVDLLLRGAPGVQMLVTSREQLRIDGEAVCLVPPLDVGASIDLFVARANTSASTQPASAELEKIGAMCRRLEGIPLAIELAAVRVPALGVDQVAELLTHRLEFLSRGRSRLDSPRHQTLRAALDWSYALLDPAEQRLFASLAVFVGGWSLEAARRVSIDVRPGAVLDSLSGLIDKSLVIGADDDAGERRFRFLETVREYALEKLVESDDHEQVRAGHLHYVRTLTEQGAATRLGTRYPGDVARVRREHGNVRAALRWLLAEHRLDDGVALCQSLSGFWLSQGFLREGDEWLSAFLARPDLVSPQARAEGLHAWGRLAEYAGELDRAGELFEQSLVTSIANEDATTAARALCGLGDLALHRGAHDQALARFRAALHWARAADSPPETAQALLCLGRAASLRGDLPAARDWLEQALAIERRLADRWGVAYGLNEMAQIARRAGEPDRARALMEECHVLWRQVGTRMGERAAVMNLAVLAVEQGGGLRAAELARDGLEISVDLRDSGSATTVRAVEIAAQVLLAAGEPGAAATLAAAAEARRSLLGAPRPSIEQPDIDHLWRAAAAALDAPAIEQARTRGTGLPIGEAIGLAAVTLTGFIDRR